MKSSFFFLAAILALSGTTSSQKTFSVTFNFRNVELKSSELMVALYNKPENFMDGPELDARIIQINALSKPSTTFELPLGTYAIAVYQDLNSNGKFDKNFVGYPTERYGFSNNPGFLMRAPKWEEVVLNVREGVVHDIELK